MAGLTRLLTRKLTRGMTTPITSPTGGGVTPPPVPTAVALDPPVTAAMVSRTIAAIGFDQMVEGQTGNTVRLRELTGSTTHDFGFDANGAFDLASVTAWQPSADLDVVQFYNAIGGAAIIPSSAIAFRRSGVIGKFATTLDAVTGQLARAAVGGSGCNLAGAASISVPGTGINLTTDSVEVHLLFSNNNRKIATNDTTDTVGGATSTTEFLVAYGNHSQARVGWQIAGAAAAGTSRVQTSATDLVNANFVPFTNGGARWKKFSQNVLSHVVTASAFKVYGNGRLIQNTAMSANNITAVAGGLLNNGTVIIGASFLNSTTNTAATVTRLDAVFGGAIITKGLTDKERYTLQAKLSAIGQQHRAKAAADVMAYYDEWFFAKDVDGSGNVLGRNGLCTLAFNKGAGSTDWDFAYTIPNVGVLGIRSPTKNANNKFLANNNFFAGVITGSILSLHYNEQTDNHLHYTICREDQSYAGAIAQRGNLAIGFDHNSSGLITQFGIARAASETLFTGRFKVFPAAGSGFKAWGAAIYEANGGGLNQSMGKYNTNTTHNFFTYGETVSDPDTGTSWSWDKTSWQNANVGQPYLLDAPVSAPVAENLSATFRQDCLMLHMANFQAPAGYNSADGYAVNKPKRLSAVNTSYIVAGPQPIGHIDGSLAINANAGVADGSATDKLQSQMFQDPYLGSRVAFAFKANSTLTQAQLEEVSVNMYKLVA